MIKTLKTTESARFVALTLAAFGFVSAACARSNEPPPSTPESSAVAPARSAAPLPALRWFTNPCETPGPQACQVADPVDVPDTRTPLCAAIGAIDGEGCKQERRRCILVPAQRDRLSSCSEPARHLICAKRPPGRMCGASPNAVDDRAASRD